MAFGKGAGPVMMVYRMAGGHTSLRRMALRHWAASSPSCCFLSVLFRTLAFMEGGHDDRPAKRLESQLDMCSLDNLKSLREGQCLFLRGEGAESFALSPPL